MARGRIPPEKISDLTLNGEPIKLKKRSGALPKVRNPSYIPLDRKVEAAAIYCVTGDVKKTAELSKFTEKQVREFMKEPVWGEVQRQVMSEKNSEFLAKMNNVIDATLGMLEDRVLNGDCEIIPAVPAFLGKDGNVIRPAEDEKLMRKPVKARDLSQIFHALSHQRNLILGQPTSITGQTTTEARLERLSQHFEKLVNGKVIEGEAKVVKDGE